MNDQPNFVFDFFNIPLGLISRIEKNLVSDIKIKGPSQHVKENSIEIYSKDGRYLKFHFASDQK